MRKFTEIKRVPHYIKIKRKLFIIIVVACVTIYYIFLGIPSISVETIGTGSRDIEFSKNISSSKAFKMEESGVTLFRRPYLFDPECKYFIKKLYQENTFNQTALVSYPGSGNTWLRHLIELSTGVYTGSIYFDIDLLSRGFLGEKENWDAGSTIVQKVHIDFDKRFGFCRAILLLRDPYSSVVSFIQFLQAGHKGQGSPYIFKKKEWPKYILGQTYKWISLAKSWLESQVLLHVVHYENLKQNVTYELKSICDFLEVDCRHIYTPCFQKYLDGSFHRQSKHQFKPVFSLFVSQKIDNAIDYLNSLLSKFKHDTLPLKYYTNYRKKSQNNSDSDTAQ